MKKIVIGVTGTHASGKDTVADHISERYSIKSYSTSDEIRYEATKQGLDHSRAILSKLGNQMRTEFGNFELAHRALKRAGSEEKIVLITGIRNVGEIEYLKEHAQFYLISVDGPIELRYERAHKRERAGDDRNFEDFRLAEEREAYQGELGQQLTPCMKLADYFIVNDGTLEELNARVDEVVKAILHK